MRTSFARNLLWTIFNSMRMVDIVIGSVCTIILTFLILIVGGPEGGDEWLYYMGMVYTVPFIALVFNGILNKWEKPSGRAISIILFVVFIISAAGTAMFLLGGLIEQEPTVMFFVPFIFLFLINALMASRGVFRKKSRQLQE